MERRLQNVVAGALWAGFSTGVGWFGGKSFEESLWKPLGVAAVAAVVVAVLGELYVKATSTKERVPER